MGKEPKTTISPSLKHTLFSNFISFFFGFGFFFLTNIKQQYLTIHLVEWKTRGRKKKGGDECLVGKEKVGRKWNGPTTFSLSPPNFTCPTIFYIISLFSFFFSPYFSVNIGHAFCNFYIWTPFFPSKIFIKKNFNSGMTAWE